VKSWRHLVPLVGLLLMASGVWFLALLDISQAASPFDPDSCAGSMRPTTCW